MTTRTLTDADIKAMLGPMHAAYLDAVRANDLKRQADDALLQQALDALLTTDFPTQRKAIHALQHRLQNNP